MMRSVRDKVMQSIVELREDFISKEIYNIYSSCMYMPTWEKFSDLAQQFLNNDCVSMYSFRDGNITIGVIVIKADTHGTAEILGIAVNLLYRKNGIGKKLIDFVFTNLQLKCLIAETDDDAILFYKKCGFKTKKFIKNDGTNIYHRYNCTLSMIK